LVHLARRPNGLPGVVAHIRAAYGLDLTIAGFLLTVLWAAYALGQLPGGIVSDRIGERITLVVSTLVAGLTLLLVVGAGSAIVVFAATALFGFGTALYGVARFTIISKTYPDNGGAAIGVTLAAGDLGNAVLPVVASVVATVFVWQLGFAFVVPLFAFVSVGLWFVVPKQDADADDSGMVLSRETARYVVSELRRPPIVVVTLIFQILGFSLALTLTGFYPTYLIEEKGLSPAVAAALFSLYFALGVFVKPLAGSAYDRFGIRRTPGDFRLGDRGTPVAVRRRVAVVARLGHSSVEQSARQHRDYDAVPDGPAPRRDPGDRPRSLANHVYALRRGQSASLRDTRGSRLLR